MRASFAIAMGLAGMLATAAAAEEEPARLYERQCRGCHFEQGADLAHLKFKLENDVPVVARSNVPVETLLRRHHGVALSKSEMSSLLGLFRASIK
ncbi:MAG: hypothetical protein NW223_08210 [Hyphomicrobiaceae bacterium]|nr:hypothetical protein [Hyphomicrobiaceae bacterium]